MNGANLSTIIAVTALLLMAPVGLAGTFEDPEIADPEGDHLTGQNVDPINAIDIVSVLLTEEMGFCDDATHVTMIMQLANIVTGNSGAPGAAFSSSIYFTINENEYRTYMRPAPNLNTGGPADPWIYMYDITGAPSDRMVIPGGVDNSEHEKIWWCVPYENLNGAQPGDAVTALWGRTYLDNYGVTDRAPDEGFGRDYALGGAAAVVVAEGNLTVESPQNGTGVAVAPGSSGAISIGVTNHAGDNDTVNFVVTEVSEGWEATIDPANITVEPNGTAFTNLTVTPTDDNATVGTFTVTYNSTLGVSGNLTFTASVSHDSMDHMDSMDGNTTGNGTVLEDDAAIPGVGPLALLTVTFLVAAAYRRRR